MTDEEQALSEAWQYMEIADKLVVVLRDIADKMEANSKKLSALLEKQSESVAIGVKT